VIDLREHQGLVRWQASKIMRQMPQRLGTHLDYDDLVAVGLRGLWEAATRYDSTKGASFATFAVPRIRGAMLDHIRDSQWASRRTQLRGGPFWQTVPLDGLQNIGQDGFPDEVAERLDLHAAVAALPERKREIVWRYFWGEQTLAEIGAAFGCTDSRICQLKSQILNQLRAAL
jgi:RNA polymerase sigma factor for flagellar operon FliA